MQIQVVSSYVDDPSVTTSFAGLTVPASCLIEDARTGNRWVLFNGSISEHHWADARTYGAVGVVRPVPLGYIEQTVFSDRADRRGSMTIDEKLFIPCDELPLVPEKQRPMNSFAPFVHLHAHSEFCLAPETLVCTADMVWKKIGDVVPGEVLVGFDEDLRPEEGQRGNSRSKMRPSVVLAAKRRVRDCYRITLEDGTSIISSAKHGWVVTGSTRGSLIEPDGPEGGCGSNTRRWLTTERLGVGLPDRWGHTHPTKLPKLVKWASPWSEVPFSLQREASYLAGIIDGEGWLHEGQLQLAQNPGPVLDEIKRCCEALGYPVTADRVQSSKGECRMFRFAGYETALRVLSQCDPVRFRDRWEEVWVGRRAGSRYSRPVQIVSVEHLGEMETVALTTSTKTFVAEGFLSHNSPLDGLATPEEMVARAVALDQFAIAVTDHGYCAAHPLLQKAATAAGVKPIFGIEANLVRNRHLREDRYDYWHFLLLARNEVGLRNLWGASSEAHIEGFYGRPRMDFETLARFSEGVIGSTACLRGPLKQLVMAGDEQGAKEMIAKLRAIFPESLYLEIHTNALPEQIELNKALVQLGKEMSLPLVAVCDAHYAEDCDHHLHKAWIAAQTDKDLSADQDLFSGDEHYYLRSHVEVADSIAYLGQDAVHEAMSNTVDIARSCDVTIKQGSAKPVYHRYVAPGFEATSSGAERDIEVLREKCEAGFVTKRLAEADQRLLALRSEGADVETYRERLERELAVMIDKGFAGYFLIVEDYSNAARQGRTSAKKRLLMGPGRGSVVGSLVAYLLGITQVDPIEADLLFERFITAGRTSPPDIDLDFPSSERPAITEYITHRWGEDRVVRVGTHGRLQNKGVMRSLEKVFRSDVEHAMEWTDLVEITKIIDAAEAHTAGLGLKWDDLWEQEGDLLEPYRQKYPQIFDYAERMVKRLKSYGRHASGVVIDPEHPIVDRLPLRTAGDKDQRQVVTEFDMEALELLGYLKFDILTLRTLDTIQMCLDMIEADEFYGGKLRIDIDAWRDEYNDPQVWDMLCSGDTLGVFQIETSSGTRLVKRMQPRSIADLSAILTLVRPGPMRSGLTDTYIKRRFGEEPVVAIHPRLEPVLGRTYQCFAAETEVITRNGTRRIGDLFQSVGEQIMDGNGRWVDADVRWFGEQSLSKITVKRNKQTKDIFATSDHRWFARWGDSKSRFIECTTDGLRPGMILRSGMPNGAQNTNLSPVGACAGIVFGDGVCTPHSSYVDLWGDKNIDLLHLFGEQRRSAVESDTRCALPRVRVFDMPRSWKSLPSLDEGASFLLGWMAGYFAADGCVSQTGQAVLSSARREDLEWFRTVANIVGIGTYGITETIADKAPPGQPLRTATMYQVGLVASSIPEGFFLISEHAERFAEAKASRVRADRTQWTVVSVEATDRVENVYCAVVPTTFSFVLEDHILTGNCMIYQEDIMAVCSTLAGYDLEQSDKVRAILGKKKVEEAAKEGVKFVDRAVERGIERPLAEAVWAQMQEFAKYTFNRAHSWSYAVLAYWCAWLKCHFPAHFAVAVLSTIEKGRIPEFVEMTRRNGYEVLPPDVNESAHGFTVSANRLGVRYGFGSISQIGEATSEAIVQGQPYSSWEDFIERRGSKCNFGHIRTLAGVGTFDRLIPEGKTRPALLSMIELLAAGKATTCQWKIEGYNGPNGLPCTFDWSTEVTIGKSGKPLKAKPLPKQCTKACRQYVEREGGAPWPDLPGLTKKQVRDREREVLGVYLSSTPFDAVPLHVLDERGIIYGEEFDQAPNGNHGVYAMINSVRLHEDKAGRKMAFVRVNSLGFEHDITVFSTAYQRYSKALAKDTLCIIDFDRNDRGMTLNHVFPIDQEQAAALQPTQEK
jgi:DNA-directed DNA polymerase III PolC